MITSNLNNINKFLDLDNFTFIQHDIQESIYFDEDIDYVVHLASCASPKAYSKFPINTLKSGSIGTINALGIAKKHNAQFFLASTSEIYGDPEVSPQPEDYWGNVNPNGERSMYDEAKRFAEAATATYSRTYDLNTKVVRIFNSYGPRMQLNDGRVVTNFIVQALKNEDITIYGDGTQTRSFLHVNDNIDFTLKILDSGLLINEVVNVGSDVEISIIDLAHLIKETLNSKSKISFLPPLKDGDMTRRKPDITKMKSSYKKEIISLKEGIKTVAIENKHDQ